MDVFDRIHGAAGNGQGVTLSALDVQMLMDLCGDAMAKAEADLELWRERLGKIERMAATEAAHAGQNSTPV